MPSFVEIAAEVGKLTERKNQAYGDSYARVGEALKLMWPNGTTVSEFGTVLLVARVLDKLFRLAWVSPCGGVDLLDESPWLDIAGYALCALRSSAEVPHGGR